jgi:PAS domain S-box-containing protein
MSSDHPREGPDAWHLTDDLHVQQGKGDPFAAAIRATRMPMVITDPRRHDNPIVFANDAFLKLTGYGRDEVVGRNCRFLQGPETDGGDIDKVREAVRNVTDISIDLLNYRKDGSTYWNALYMSPVSNEAGELQFFFASQLDVTERKEAQDRMAADKKKFERAVKSRTKELEVALDAQTTLLHEVDHRVKNNLQMVASLILMQSRTIEDATVRRSLRDMLERVEALSTVHRRLYQSQDVSQFDVADFARDLVTDLLMASGRSRIHADFDLHSVVIPAQKAAPIALIVNELVTNALKHGYPHPVDGEASGRLGVSMRQVDGHFNFAIEDDGPGMPDGTAKQSFGMKLLRSLARQLQAKIEWQDAEPGTRVTLRVPNEVKVEEARSSA